MTTNNFQKIVDGIIQAMPLVIRNYQAVINQAKLLASPAQEVFNYLEERAGKLIEERAGKSGIYSEKDADEELELSLLKRNDPLINLGLAKYGAYRSTLRLLFNYSKEIETKALRYSLLANQTIDISDSYEIPPVFFATPSDKLEYFKNAHADELYVIFQNPTISAMFLVHFLDGDEFWHALDEERQLITLQALADNESIMSSFSDSDDFRSLKYRGAINSIWKLAETLPVNFLSAYRLGTILEQLNAFPWSLKHPLEIAKRWNIELVDSELKQIELEDNNDGILSGCQKIRKSLARVTLQETSKLPEEFLISDDVVHRAAVYRSCQLSPEQISSCFMKDGRLFFCQAINNEVLWMQKSSRSALKQVAGEIDRSEGPFHFWWRNSFALVAQKMVDKHPNWFIGDEDAPIKSAPENSAYTVDDLNQIALHINQGFSKLIRESIQNMSKQINWIFWFSLGALVATLVKH